MYVYVHMYVHLSVCRKKRCYYGCKCILCSVDTGMCVAFYSYVQASKSISSMQAGKKQADEWYNTTTTLLQDMARKEHYHRHNNMPVGMHSTTHNRQYAIAIVLH